MHYTSFQDKQHRIFRIGHDKYSRLGAAFGERVNVETFVATQAGYAFTTGPIGGTIEAFHPGVDVDQQDVAAGSDRDRFLSHEARRVDIVDLYPAGKKGMQCLFYELWI